MNILLLLKKGQLFCAQKYPKKNLRALSCVHTSVIIGSIIGLRLVF